MEAESAAVVCGRKVPCSPMGRRWDGGLEAPLINRLEAGWTHWLEASVTGETVL